MEVFKFNSKFISKNKSLPKFSPTLSILASTPFNYENYKNSILIFRIQLEFGHTIGIWTHITKLSSCVFFSKMNFCEIEFIKFIIIIRFHEFIQMESYKLT